MRKFIGAALAVVLTLSVLLCGCGSNVTVSVQSVSLITGVGSVGLYDRFAGVVESGETVKLEKINDLTVLECLVSVGDTVSAGQTLYRYDVDTIRLDLDKKKLELEQLQSSIQTKNEQIAQLEREKANASASSQLDYTIQIQELQMDVTQAKFDISAKEKEITLTQSTLENAEVTSPVDGCVQSINENGGTDNAGNPLPYMTVAQTGDYRIKGTINEQSVNALQPGLSVLIRSRTDDTVTWKGTVAEIDWNNPLSNNNNNVGYGISTDTASADVTASKYPFYISLDSDDGLMLGQHVYIEPDFGQNEEASFSLSSAYILDADSAPYVWAANSRDKLEKRSVTLGEYNTELDSYPITGGLTTEDYIAFPDETCQVGATVSYYDENSFGGDEQPGENGNGGAVIGGEGGISNEAGIGGVDDGMIADDGAVADDGMVVDDGAVADDGMVVDDGTVADGSAEGKG